MFTAALLAIAMQPTLASQIDAIRVKYGLPSITAGTIVNGKITDLEAVGVRRMGSDEKVTTEDRYHIGSNTKSFTAALFGVLVQQGKVKWDTPLSEIFPDIAMDPAYKNVTAIHLTSHRSGLDGNTFAGKMPGFTLKTPIELQRMEYTQSALMQKPMAEPGAKYVYANRGFIVLGTAMEKLTGKTWESLVKSEILDPLGLKSAGFGAPGWMDHTSQPWGHIMQNGKLVPIPPGPNSDNKQVVGPAGTLHMSVPDMLKYCWFQAQEGRNGGILEPSTFKMLHSAPFGGNYGGGFLQVDRPWAGGIALTHSGSNTMNYQTIWIAPKKGFAVVVSTNAVVPDVGKAMDEVASLLIARALR